MALRLPPSASASVPGLLLRSVARRATPTSTVALRSRSIATAAAPAAAASAVARAPRRRQVCAVSRRPGHLGLRIRQYSSSSGPAAGESKIYNFEDIQKITKEHNPNIILVDVREPAELQATGRIPGAVNIPITSAPDSFHISPEEFEDRFGFARPPPSSEETEAPELVFYCKAGVRGRAAAGLARDAGYARVGEYPGSWLDWAAKGGEVER